MKVSRLISALALGALLAACGTTVPSSYYMLTADAAGIPEEHSTSIGVGPISIPDYMTGRGMVLSRDGHQINVSEFDRWAEPLEAGISRVLILNLAALMNSQEVYAFPWRSDGVPEYGVRVSVVQFILTGGDARLVASWSLRHARTDEMFYQALSQFESPVPDKEPETVADVYSALLLELSREIAEEIKRDMAQPQG
jgi:hypothetical protein